MRLAVLSLLCLFVACFQEPPADRMWRCTVDKPQCPEGQSCVNDWCVKDGTAMPDLLSQDGPSVDMIGLPCLNGSPIGTQGAWACKGAFAPSGTKASMLCLNGYKLCTDGNRITDAQCSSSALTGYFFADVAGEGVSLNLSKCASGGPSAGSVWFGCGTYQGAPQITARTQYPCKNLPLVAGCDPKSGFTCNLTDIRLDAQKSDNAANGVLCCPP